MPPETVISYAALVQALAALVSAGLAGALVWVTIRYARATEKIVEESRMARAANEGSAAAALQSVYLLRQQIEDQAQLGLSIVHTTIDSAVSAVTFWKDLDIVNSNAYRFPPTDGLVPKEADSAVNHARRVSFEVAAKLSSGFDDLRNARNEIEVVKQGVKLTGQNPGLYAPNCARAAKLLESAWTKLLEAKGLVPFSGA